MSNYFEPKIDRISLQLVQLRMPEEILQVYPACNIPPTCGRSV
jgi:hypothetical protein